MYNVIHILTSKDCFTGIFLLFVLMHPLNNEYMEENSEEIISNTNVNPMLHDARSLCWKSSKVVNSLQYNINDLVTDFKHDSLKPWEVIPGVKLNNLSFSTEQELWYAVLQTLHSITVQSHSPNIIAISHQRFYIPEDYSYKWLWCMVNSSPEYEHHNPCLFSPTAIAIYGLSLIVPRYFGINDDYCFNTLNLLQYILSYIVAGHHDRIDMVIKPMSLCSLATRTLIKYRPDILQMYEKNSTFKREKVLFEVSGKRTNFIDIDSFSNAAKVYQQRVSLYYKGDISIYNWIYANGLENCSLTMRDFENLTSPCTECGKQVHIMQTCRTINSKSKYNYSTCSGNASMHCRFHHEPHCLKRVKSMGNW